ncbi:hypothetical protein RJT34_07922 [Clitoria ternatea]|uniref:Uncharacterized protein n=1 Tax=Clitoria ternatea TaxID=43366 RepID=A0AAN9PVB2_CLITE
MVPNKNTIQYITSLQSQRQPTLTTLSIILPLSLSPHRLNPFSHSRRFSLCAIANAEPSFSSSAALAGDSSPEFFRVF